MNLREIAFVGCRFFSIFTFLNAFNQLNAFWQSASYAVTDIMRQRANAAAVLAGSTSTYSGTPIEQYAIQTGIQLIPVLISWLIAIILWRMSPEISGAIVSRPEAQWAGVKFRMRTSQWPDVAFATLGVWMLAGAVPHFVTAALGKIWEAFDGRRTGYYGFDLATILSITLGLWLVFGRRGLVGLWVMARDMGKPPRPR